MSKENPYSRLKAEALSLQRQALYPERVGMWLYPKDKLTQGWNLSELAQRVAAADQLGFDVNLRFSADGLQVDYVKRPSKLPYWV